MTWVKRNAEVCKPGDWFADCTQNGCAFLYSDRWSDGCPGVVMDKKTKRWFIWPADRNYFPAEENEYNEEEFGPLYPTRKAAMTACRLIYPVLD